MRLKLTRLVLITCTALLGIIALQVFWLINAYKAEREKLLTMVDNVLMETHVLSGVNAGLNTSVQSLFGDIVEGHLQPSPKDGHKKKDTIVISSIKSYQVNIQPETIPAGDKGEMAEKLLKMMGIDTSVHKSFTIREYRDKVRRSLRLRGVKLPFEMAMIDAGGDILACTVDTSLFRDVDMKTTQEYSLPVTLRPGLSGRIQLAFPSGLTYLLKEIGVILLLSSCLIIVCAFSFSYMVALFYRQKKLAEIRNDFMNNMTHELKTPISAVSVALELLQDESVSMDEAAKREYFGIAGNELNRLTLLVDKVLRMSAFEKAQVQSSPQWFVFRDLLTEVLGSVKPLMEAGNAIVTTDIKPGALKFYADKDQMSSILQNLLENAVKYADKNKPVPEIRIEAWDDLQQFYLRITDNGIGIPGQYLNRIFDKFFRVPTGDTHETKGYGLGLSYAKEIVRLHQGEITVDSDVKKGTVFTITIPK